MDLYSNRWEPVTNLSNITSTAINATNMIIRKNSLKSNSKYSLALFATSPGGTEGFAVLEFETAGQPHSGYCRPSAAEGVSMETEFLFECYGWQDKSTPLTYEFRAEEDPISYGISSKSVTTVLPSGSPENDYKLTVNVIIKNAVGVAVVEKFAVKVTIQIYGPL